MKLQFWSFSYGKLEPVSRCALADLLRTYRYLGGVVTGRYCRNYRFYAGGTLVGQIAANPALLSPTLRTTT